jgi:hypothetical protein
MGRLEVRVFRSGLPGLALFALALVWPADRALALEVGQTVSTVWLKDGSNRPAAIPDLGKKVLVLFYTDPDVKDQNEPFRDALLAQHLDAGRHRGVGVANMKDTWLPNWIIRRAVRQKAAKFKSLILTDPDHLLRKAWDLGDCNGKDVLIIVGKDRRVAFFKPGKLTDEEVRRAVQLVKDLIQR